MTHSYVVSLPRTDFCAAVFVGSVSHAHHLKARKSLSDMDACHVFECRDILQSFFPCQLLPQTKILHCSSFAGASGSRPSTTSSTTSCESIGEWQPQLFVDLEELYILAWKGDRLGEVECLPGHLELPRTVPNPLAVWRGQSLPTS